MPDPWILTSKFIPPSPPTGWLRRRFAPGAAPAPVTLLVAGPGYGKTLGLLAGLSDAVDAGAPTLWYSLDARDADPATFFHHLNAGMQAHIPQFGETVRALLGRDGLDARLLWQAFFDALAAFNLPAFTLVLDDCQHLMGPEDGGVAAALGHFFDKLPPGVRLHLASRRRWPTPLSRLGARGAVRLLGPAELRFSAEETAAFLAAQAPDGAVSAQRRALADRLDGWPLGLELACAADAGVDPLRAYVSEELYQAQPPARRTAMLQAALLAEITPEACREVFEAPDAAEHLDALAEAHLLFGLADGVAYRFPTYLHEFLRDELARALPRERRTQWHARAGAYYVARGQGELALPHLIDAEDWEAARSACDAVFPAMRFDGRLGQVRRWLSAFPAAARGEAWWQMWHAHACAHGGQSTEALAAYGAARDAHAAADCSAGVFKALVGLCNTTLTLQHEPAFRALLAEARGHGGERAREDRVDLHLIEAYEAERRGDMAGMRRHNEAALALPIAGNVEIAASHCIALTNMATHTLYMGDLAQARRYLTQAIDTAADWHFHGYRLGASFLLAYLRVLVGDMEGAGAWLGALPAMWEAVLDWHDVAIAHTVLGAYHLARGELGEAERSLDESLALFERSGFREGRKVPLERLMAVFIQRKQYARAIALADEVEPADEPGLHDWAIALPRARALHLAGRPDEALSVLGDALPALDGLGALLHVTRGRLYEAACLQTLGRSAEAQAALESAQSLIAAHDFDFLRGQDQRLWEELAAVGAPAALTAVVPAALQLRLLGPFEVRQGGLLLDQWPRRKARVLLAALAMRPEGMRADELAALVGWGEANPHNVLRVNAWALRRALEPGLSRGEPSRYLLVQGDRYRLNPQFVEAVDLLGVASALDGAEALWEAAPREAAQATERAMALVHGDLLEEGGAFAVFEPQREAFRRRCVEALHRLGAFYRHHANYGRAESALGRAIAMAPCDEATYLAAMRLYRATGRPEQVRRVYWDCRRALKTHLALVPSDAFEAAYRELTAPSR